MVSVSVLHEYSVGVAAENKPRNTRSLNVIAVEKTSSLSGEVTFNPQTNTLQGKDTDGNVYNLNTTQDASLPCEWLPDGTNRVTPPDIRRGEWVRVYRLGDTDRFFWKCMGLRDNLRTLETVILAISANPAPGGSGIDIANCYFIEMSSHEKHITLGTSKANGEPFKYTVQINTGDGEINILDDIGNHIELVSGENTIRATNADQSFVEIEHQNIRAKADALIDLTCGASNVKLTPGAIDASNGGSSIHLDSGNIAIKTGAFSVTAGSIAYSQG